MRDGKELFVRRGAGTRHSTWFGRVVLFGVFVNMTLALPTVICPNFVLGLLRVPLTHEPMWANFAAFLLILLTLFYVPAGIDPVRYRANAWLAVIARFVTAVFFLATPYRHSWLLFGLIDLMFFVPQSILLALAEREQRSVSSGSAGR